MRTFHYPKHNLKKIIRQNLISISPNILVPMVFFDIEGVLLFSGLALLMFCVETWIVVFRYKKKWIAKIDEDTIYFSSIKNAIPKNEIKEISRQIVAGDKVGINIIFNSNKVISKNFPLDDEQLEKLVEFLNS